MQGKSPLHSSDLLAQMMALHPKVIDLTLERMWGLLGKLGNPQRALPPVVHIAGTNGKGSTLAMIRAGLQAAGKMCHAYTSPHLARFHERIRLADQLISEPLLVQYLDECYAANAGENITYFEITTCAAMLAFSRTSADYTLLEVGLGGRLDATNVIDRPAACVITPIDYDHQQFLGTTLKQIAGEKAGILKRGVSAIISRQHEKALEVIEQKAARIGAPLLVQGQHWHVGTEHNRLVYQDENGLLDLPLPNLIGPHQIDNAGTALAVLRHLNAAEAAYQGAVTRAEWPARMQKLVDTALNAQFPGMELWLDGGHNPAAGRAIAHTLNAQGSQQTHIICGMINTKDIEGFIKPIAPYAASVCALTIPNEPNAVPAADIADCAASLGIKGDIFDEVEQAIESINAQNPNARVLICGSLYLAGHILREIV